MTSVRNGLKQTAEYLLPPVCLDAARLARLLLRFPKFACVVGANRRWRDAHRGESVFVLGNGPSLRGLDWSVLSGCKVIVMNSFERGMPAVDLRIVAHCFGEPTQSPAWRKEEVVASLSGVPADSHWLHFSSLRELEGLLDGKSVHFVFPGVEAGLWGSRRIELHRVTLGYATTAQLAIQVALYMGFRDLWLLGFDHDWLASPAYFRHFYADTKDESDVLDTFRYSDILTFLQRMWSIYSAIRRSAEAGGARIVNLTPGSHLDVFEKMDWEEALRAPRPPHLGSCCPGGRT